MMVAAHFIFWFVFAGIWYAVASSYAEDIGDGKEHCVTGTTSFAGLLMMSVETQVNNSFREYLVFSRTYSSQAYAQTQDYYK